MVRYLGARTERWNDDSGGRRRVVKVQNNELDSGHNRRCDRVKLFRTGTENENTSDDGMTVRSSKDVYL